ncbi:MAG TPA: ferredoxin reductase family protein [Kineosporiaceae bacterium]|nr:ferredoxin reductase family protein [Kineosporiaceae bacterium]
MKTLTGTMSPTRSTRSVPPGAIGSRRDSTPITPTGGMHLRTPSSRPNLSEAFWRTVSWALAGVSLAVVVGLWAVRAAADVFSLTSLGRLSGLLSADLLLIQVIMMARIPALERAFGQDQLVHRHRAVGRASFVLLMAHIVLITQGYAVGSGVSLPGELVDLVLHYPDMVAAAIAAGLIVLVVVTSIRRARRRLRYESWHLIHLYAYLGIGLAIPHELSTGQDFSGSVATAYWWTVYGAALGAVLVWRILLPGYRSLRHGLRVDRVVHEAPDVVSVYVRGRNLDRLQARAGQFFIWRFLDRAGWTRGHPFSLSAEPTDRELRLTVKDLGDGSGAVRRLRPGTRVLIEGPYGRMHLGARRRQRVLLLASGIGITPIRALLEELEPAPGHLTVVYRAGTREGLVLGREIHQIAAARGARVYYLLGPRRTSQRRPSWLPAGNDTLSDVEILKLLTPRVAGHEVYICGPAAWTDAVHRTVLQAGVPPARIHHERVTW